MGASVPIPPRATRWKARQNRSGKGQNLKLTLEVKAVETDRVLGLGREGSVDRQIYRRIQHGTFCLGSEGNQIRPAAGEIDAGGGAGAQGLAYIQTAHHLS